MDVVLDTNVLISAFLFRKRLKPIGAMIERGSITPCFTEPTLRELEEVLRRREFAGPMHRIGVTPDEILDMLRTHGTLVAGRSIEAQAPDPDDAKFLIAAVSCNAEAVITGDSELLGLKEFHGIPILSPAAFLRRIGEG